MNINLPSHARLSIDRNQLVKMGCTALFLFVLACLCPRADSSLAEGCGCPNNFHGIVIDEAGNGIGGVQLSLCDWSNPEWIPVTSTTTDSNGEFNLCGILCSADVRGWKVIEMNPVGYEFVSAEVQGCDGYPCGLNNDFTSCEAPVGGTAVCATSKYCAPPELLVFHHRRVPGTPLPSPTPTPTTTPAFVHVAEIRPPGQTAFAPTSLKMGPTGDLYVLDQADQLQPFVQVFSAAGVWQRKWSVPDIGWAGDVTLDASGRIYIVDSVAYSDDYNARLRIFTPEGSLLDTRYLSLSAYPSQLQIALAPNGNLYIAVTPCSMYCGGTIEVFTTTGTPLGSWAWGYHGTASGLAIGPDNTICVAVDVYGSIMCFRPDGSWVRSIGRAGCRNGQLVRPHGLAIRDDGVLFVADTGNQRIQAFSPTGDFLFLFGQEDYHLLALTPSGNLYAATTDHLYLFRPNVSPPSPFLWKREAEEGNLVAPHDSG